MTDFLNGLVSQIDPETLKVHVPSRVVFLCGGAIDNEEPPGPPKMLRDVYYRHRYPTLASLPYKIILAEDAEPLTIDAGYGDLLSFESDIAQIVGLIVLFVESAGSFAELGAFAALETIAPSLLAVMLDHYYDQQSFIKNGPIKYLEEKHGEESVLSLEMADLEITKATEVSLTNAEELARNLEDTVSFRMNSLAKWKSFDPGSQGHKILVMTGLCQEYGALTQKEVRKLMEALKIPLEATRLKNFIYCAELMGWVKLIRKGHQKYIVALNDSGQEKALDWKFVQDCKLKDRLRWRSDIRAHWKKHDTLRHRAISEVDQLDE